MSNFGKDTICFFFLKASQLIFMDSISGFSRSSLLILFSFLGFAEVGSR